MKRLLTLLLSAALVLAFSVFAMAANENRMREVAYRDIKITLNGEAVETPSEPIIIEGVTYLPVRALAAALGLDVQWDAENYTVILAEKPEERPVYITRTGIKYHYDKQCNGGTYWPVSLETATGFGLEPCDKCVLTIDHPEG